MTRRRALWYVMGMSDNPTPHAPEEPPQSPGPHPPGRKFGSNETDWAMLTHLSGLCCLVSIPGVVGPLVFWMIKKEEMPLVDRAGKEAINFQLTMLIGQLISIPLIFIGVGFITLIAFALLAVIFAIIAGVEANKGNDYRYPLTFRFFT